MNENLRILKATVADINKREILAFVLKVDLNIIGEKTLFFKYLNEDRVFTYKTFKTWKEMLIYVEGLSNGVAFIKPF